MKCCFVGHTGCTGIENEVQSEIRKMVGMGVSRFYSRGISDFDKMCEKVAKELGGKILLVTYSGSLVQEDDKLWYDEIIKPAEKTEQLEYNTTKRDNWLVENCDIFLCCAYSDGEEMRMLDYAESLGRKKIINLFHL